jgi:hypothetical protein
MNGSGATAPRRNFVNGAFGQRFKDDPPILVDLRFTEAEIDIMYLQ